MNLIHKWSGDISKHKMHHSVRFPDPALPVSCKACGFHEEDSCVQYLMWDFFERWQQSAMMYVPLYLVPRLLLSSNRLLTDPVKFTHGYVRDVLLSGLFLATYILFPKATICTWRKFGITNAATLPVAVIAGASAGPSVLWERYSRRIELLSYVSQRVCPIISLC